MDKASRPRRDGLRFIHAQQIIEAHGGRIQLASVVGRNHSSSVLPAVPPWVEGAESRIKMVLERLKTIPLIILVAAVFF